MRIKRPPQYPTRCPHWDGFRWSQRAARERSESHSGLNWTHHESWLRPLVCARRRGLFQLRLMLAERGITTGFRVAGHIWAQHTVGRQQRDYVAEIRRLNIRTHSNTFTLLVYLLSIPNLCWLIVDLNSSQLSWLFFQYLSFLFFLFLLLCEYLTYYPVSIIYYCLQ